MRRILHLGMTEAEKGKPVLMGFIESKKPSPDRLRIFLGGMPWGDFGIECLRQADDDRAMSVLKFNRFRDADKIFQMAESAGLDIVDREIVYHYAVANKDYRVSPIELADEAVAFLNGVFRLEGRLFAGRPSIIAHSYGGFSVAVRLRELMDDGVLGALAERGGRLTLVAPVLIRPELKDPHDGIEEISERFAGYGGFFSSVPADAGRVAALEAEGRFWNGDRGLELPFMDVQVVVCDDDRRGWWRSKDAVAEVLAGMGTDARLTILAIHGLREDMEEGRISILPLERSVLDEARARFGDLDTHDLYPYLMMRAGLDIF